MYSHAESYNQTNLLQYRDGTKMICDIKSALSKEGTKRPEIILDIGCGTGNLTEFLYEKFHPRRLIAMDISDEMIKFASANKPRSWPIDYHAASIAESFDILSKKLDLEESSVDLIVSTYVFHWLWEDDRKKAMKNLYKFLKPNGRFYLMIFGRSETLSIAHECGLTDKWKDYLLKKLNTDPKTGKLFGLDVANTTTELETFQAWDKVCLESKLWMEDCHFTYTRCPYKTVQDVTDQMRISWWNALVEDDKRKDFENDQEDFFKKRLFNRLMSVERHRRDALDITGLDDNPELHLPYQYIIVNGKKFI